MNTPAPRHAARASSGEIWRRTTPPRPVLSGVRFIVRSIPNEFGM